MHPRDEYDRSPESIFASRMCSELKRFSDYPTSDSVLKSVVTIIADWDWELIAVDT